jgi:hypothetical protein
VVGNASCWALHMGLSSNLRYQMLNGLDMVSERAGAILSGMSLQQNGWQLGLKQMAKYEFN